VAGSAAGYSAFSRLAPAVREYIYEKRWKSLRSIQEAAITAILDGDGHTLIASPTASGKTEACFFPVISLLCETNHRSVGALYISPLKALINDQAARLGGLMERVGLPLWSWHGDVSGRHKQRLLDQPSGILQITPESLEALLIRSPAILASLFGGLQFVVIDEAHSFMGNERGSQVRCQLARVEEAAGCRPRRVGLSATLGDYRAAMKWLAGGKGADTVTLVREEGQGRRVRIALDYYSREEDGERAYYEALYREAAGRRCIIFTNSRNEAEDTIAAMRALASELHTDESFLVHHGSVSASLRAETERELRDSAGAVTVAATATLEMGIDIGKLDRVMQIGAPFSVSAFVQRLGRSGRLRGKPEMYFTSLEERLSWEHPVNGLPWDLIKTIAVIELYRTGHWIETGVENPLPYGLLVHQIVSILLSLGEQRPELLEKRVLSLPAFSRFSGEDFRELAAHLASLDIIEKTEDGAFIAGLEAEKLAAHYSFYSVFAGAAEYRVIAGGREIGVVNFIPPEGGSIVLAGRYWRVESIAEREREIWVSPGDAGGQRVWRGSGAELHRRVAAYMRTVLTGENTYPYLSERARTRLQDARRLARQWQLATEIFIPSPEEEETSRRFILLPWLGSRALRTLLLVMQHWKYRKPLGLYSLSRETDFSINIHGSLSIPDFRAVLADLIARHRTPQSLYPLIEGGKIPLRGKFDRYLPPAALVRQYAASMLDLEAIKTLGNGVF
jgi:ATP-dependent Lhr-like helicase